RPCSGKKKTSLPPRHCPFKSLAPFALLPPQPRQRRNRKWWGTRWSPAWRPPGPPRWLLRRPWPPSSWVSCGSCQSPRDLGELLPSPPPVAKRRLSARTSNWDNILCEEPPLRQGRVPCFPAPNITCKDFGGNETHFTGNEVGFLKPISCRNVNGYSYKVAVALSLFLGWLGADRFYLGYPALGLLKFCTVGFCGIGSLIDFILISMQIVGPSDGSSYIIDYYGTRLTRLSITNETFRKTQLYP
uniref:TM2 domain containing 1 n=1 Tax=Ailuropoda melanoleuca TaxID=9646 RepID=A0A7N5KIY4_AILME